MAASFSRLTEAFEATRIQSEMREKSNKFLTVLIALALSVLPMHFTQAAVACGSGSFGEIVVHNSGMSGCAHAGASHGIEVDDNYPSCDNSADNCCGDNCSGAQMVLTQHFSFQLLPATDFEMIWTQRLPDSLSSTEYRPPIALS